MVPSSSLRAAEHDDEKGVDDIELAGGWGLFDPIIVNAEPATPAMPQPSPNVSMSMCRVSMPTASLMVRFATTARTCSPQRERYIKIATTAVMTNVSPITNSPLIWTSIDFVTGKRAHHPRRQFDADLARSEDRAERLLHDEAQSPGREQGIERPSVEMAYQQPLDRKAERARHDKGDHHSGEEVTGIRLGR